MVTTVTDDIRTRPNTLFGFDASQYQNPIDWLSMVNDGVKFAYLRAFGSNHTGTGDTSFENYIIGAKTKGVPTGGYFYCTPTNPYSYDDVKLQANLFINKLKSGYGGGYGASAYGDLTPMIDVEDNSGNVPKGQSTLDISVDDLLKWCDEFRKYFEDKTGRQLGIYTNYYFVQTQRNNFNEGKTPSGNIIKDMPLWLSMWTRYNFNDALPVGGWENPLIWQYSDGGVFSGIPSNKCDLDLAKTPNIQDLLSHKAIPTQNLITQTDVETSTNTNKTDVATTTVTVTTTTTTTWKEDGMIYELPTY